MTIAPGTVVGGRYEILRSLGAGGMGAVYLASDPRYDFQVAVKVLYPGVVRSAEARDRFRTEINACYRVTHPNVVQAFEFFDEGDLVAYAMEYVDGGDLLSRIEHSVLPSRDAADVMRQMAAGLGAIHQEGILHRDLKPENVLLAADGTVKISDFGVARLAGGDRRTVVGAMVGTPKYVAPEYVKTGACDARADIFALGVIGFEMLTGCSPFRSATTSGLLAERFESKAGVLARLVPRCPPEFVRIIEKAMAVDPDDRYRSAADVLADLERFLGLEAAPSDDASGDAAPPADEWTIPAAAGRPRSRLWSGAACLLLLAAVGRAAERSVFRPADGLAGLPPGRYAGTLTGVLGRDRTEPLYVWSTKAGVSALLGKPGCAASDVAADGTFRCGDLVIRLGDVTADRVSAEGTATEITWGVTGRFRIGLSDDG